MVVTPLTTTPAPVAIDDYFSRQRGIGIFHKSRLVIGAMQGTAPMATATVPGMTEDRTQFTLALEGGTLTLPSTFGNYHGIEFSTGLRSSPIDFWLTIGTAMTLLSIGHGEPLTFRIGGGFGGGFDLARGYGYVRGRAAVVLVPRRLDAEVSMLWSPPSAGTGRIDERITRISAWYRMSTTSERAFEGYLEWFRRVDEAGVNERTFDGVGAGVGITLF